MMRGFTLIELLVVIGIIANLAALVLVAIDPIDKINVANDSKVQRDINALANAMEAYAVTHDATYATDQAALVTGGELKLQLVPPSGYLCDGSTNAYVVDGALGKVYCVLKSKKYTQSSPATPYWMWCSSSSRGGATVDSTTCP